MGGNGNGGFESVWSDLQGVSFSQGYVEAAGIRPRYLHSGSSDQPGLIFLHGTGGHAEAYTRNLGPHGEHFNTYAIDMLGHGYTGKPDYDYEIPRYIEHILGFMDAVGMARASLSGESLGGWIAGAFAVAHPDRVAGLADRANGRGSIDQVGDGPEAGDEVEHLQDDERRDERVSEGRTDSDDLRHHLATVALDEATIAVAKRGDCEDARRNGTPDTADTVDAEDV